VPLYFFLFIAAVTLVPMWLSARTQRARLDVVREALARGQPLDPALLSILAEGRDPRGAFRHYLSWGVIITSLGLGLTAAAFLGPAEARSGLSIGAGIDLCLGVGFLVVAVFARGWSNERPGR